MLNELLQSELLFIAGALLAAIILLMVVFVWYRRSRHYLKQFDKVLRNHAHACLREIFIPDGIDGHTWVDCLIATDTGIWVLDIRDYEGDIFASENIDEWTQLLQGRSLKFNNPLQQNELRVQATRLIVKDIPVHSLVVFGEKARFPKRRPGGVIFMHEFQDVLANDTHTRIDSTRIQATWQALRQCIVADTRYRAA